MCCELYDTALKGRGGGEELAKVALKKNNVSTKEKLKKLKKKNTVINTIFL